MHSHIVQEEKARMQKEGRFVSMSRAYYARGVLRDSAGAAPREQALKHRGESPAAFRTKGASSVPEQYCPRTVGVDYFMQNRWSMLILQAYERNAGFDRKPSEH